MKLTPNETLHQLRLMKEREESAAAPSPVPSGWRQDLETALAELRAEARKPGMDHDERERLRELAESISDVSMEIAVARMEKIVRDARYQSSAGIPAMRAALTPEEVEIQNAIIACMENYFKNLAMFLRSETRKAGP